MTNKGKGLTALINTGEPEESDFMHVDTFIAHGLHRRDANEEPNENYARWVLDYFRGSAICKMDFSEFMGYNLLFCEYEGEKYRVTGASRLGDVWLTRNFKQDTGYEKRVEVTNCSNWQRK